MASIISTESTVKLASTDSHCVILHRVVNIGFHYMAGYVNGVSINYSESFPFSVSESLITQHLELCVVIGSASYQELSWKVSGRSCYVRNGRFTLWYRKKYRNDNWAIMLIIQMCFWVSCEFGFCFYGVYVRYWRLLDVQISSDQGWSTPSNVSKMLKYVCFSSMFSTCVFLCQMCLVSGLFPLIMDCPKSSFQASKTVLLSSRTSKSNVSVNKIIIIIVIFSRVWWSQMRFF